MNIARNLAKSSLLAFVIFWIIIGRKEFNMHILPFVMLSYIPIYICVLLVYFCSIGPFFWSAKGRDFSNTKVFKICFPYFTCSTFGLCSYGIIASDYDLYFTAFCISAYITMNQTWVWLAKESKNEPSILIASITQEHD